MTNDLFLRACRQEVTERPPVWIMRQAGRYMPEYRALREGLSFLEFCKNPELCTQATLLPIDMLEVDVATGEELRWFGYVPGSWSFEPPESAFVYQHGVTYTPEGTLLVSSQVDRSSYEGVVREYAVDEDDQVLREVWSHGEGDGITARYAGEAHRLPGGNTLHNTGTTPRVREITPEGEVAWDLSFDGDKLIGRTTWLEDLYTYAP